MTLCVLIMYTDFLRSGHGRFYDLPHQIYDQWRTLEIFQGGATFTREGEDSKYDIFHPKRAIYIKHHIRKCMVLQCQDGARGGEKSPPPRSYATVHDLCMDIAFVHLPH